jgi:hypothetical protein
VANSHQFKHSVRAPPIVQRSMHTQNHAPRLVNLTVRTNWRFSQRDQYVGSPGHLPKYPFRPSGMRGCAGRHGLAAVQQPRELRGVAHFRRCFYFEKLKCPSAPSAAQLYESAHISWGVPGSQVSPQWQTIGTTYLQQTQFCRLARRCVEFGSTGREIEYRALTDERFCNGRPGKHLVSDVLQCRW